MISQKKTTAKLTIFYCPIAPTALISQKYPTIDKSDHSEIDSLDAFDHPEIDSSGHIWPFGIAFFHEWWRLSNDSIESLYCPVMSPYPT